MGKPKKRFRIIDSEPQHLHDDRHRSRAEGEKGYIGLTRCRDDFIGNDGGWGLYPLEPKCNVKTNKHSDGHVGRRSRRLREKPVTNLSPRSQVRSAKNVVQLSKQTNTSVRQLLKPGVRDEKLPSRATLYRRLKIGTKRVNYQSKTVTNDKRKRGRPRKIVEGSSQEQTLCNAAKQEYA